MKHLTVAFILILILTNVFAQELKTVKIKTPAPVSTKEEFQVFKDKKSVKNGTYKKWKGRNLIETGFFKSNSKDSLWKIYSQKGILIATGNYELNLKTDIWSYFSKSGILVQKYDHDKDTLVYFNLAEEKKFGHAPDIYPDTALEQMPIFIGGISYMNTLIENNIIYPMEALIKDKSASIFVSFVVDTNGNTINVKSISNAGYGFDEEGVRIIEQFGKAWIPGIQKGKKVKVQYKLHQKNSPIDHNFCCPAYASLGLMVENC
jgi:antitoxin component YwqK of YwqJK toxin-antitoxin module